MYAGSFAIPYDVWTSGCACWRPRPSAWRMGLERILRGKPTGIRTLGLVSFAAALVTLATAHADGIEGSPKR